MNITTRTICEADKQYALYKKGQRELPQKTTFLGKPIPKDQKIMAIIMSPVSNTHLKNK